MSADHRLYDLVAEWDRRRQEGEELPAAALCTDCPDLIPALEKRIASVKATDWLLGPDDEDDDLPSLQPEFTRALPVPASVSLDQLRAGIIASGLLTADQIQQAEATDAGDLATKLVQAKQLTEYQVQQIAAGNTTGLVLGNYVILDKIGSGGMGTVFKARHQRMKRAVALKIISKEALDSPTAVERFRREVEAAARLDHANIVTGYDADECQGTHFLVMEFVDGQDLQSLVRKQGRLPIGAAVDCILQAAQGLEYAHQQGVIHRDIKPANLLLSRQGVLKILDMGLARLDNPDGTDSFVAAQAELTADGTVLGTIDYLAPEQALDTHTADARADVYSLGCTLYHLLTAKPMYGGGTLMAKMLAHRDGRIPSVREERPDVPERLAMIFEKMVAKSPDARYVTMTVLRAELEMVAGQYKGTWERQFREATAVAGDTDADMQFKDTDRGDTQVTPRKSGPQVVPAPRPKFRKRRPVIFIGSAAALLLLGYWLFGILFRVETPAGIIQIATNVTDVEVFVDDEKTVYLTDPRDKGKIRVEIPEGAETLRVRKDGFEADVQEFKLSTVKGPIRVTFVPLPKTGGPSESGDIDRGIAEWVIGLGGYVAVDEHGLSDVNIFPDKSISDVNQLPSHPFRLTHVALHTGVTDKPVVDEDFERLTRLRALEWLSLRTGPSSDVSDRCMDHLAKIPSLRRIAISGPAVTGDGIARLNNLSLKSFAGYELTDVALEHLAQHAEIDTVYMNFFRGSEKGLKHLEGLPSLNSLTFRADPSRPIKLTDAGTMSLARMKSLQEVCLADWDLQNADFDVLAQSGAVLEELEIDRCTLGEETLLQLSALGRLNELLVDRCSLARKDIAGLARSTTIKTVRFQKVRLSEDDLVLLAEMPLLNCLTLDFCSISDDGLAAVAKIIRPRSEFTLEILNAPAVTDAGLKHLHTAAGLRVLRHSKTSASAHGLAELRKALPNCLIE